MDTTTAPSPGRRRDADAARAAAAARVATAHLVADAVGRFHDAADRIDTAQAELRAATAARTAAVADLRGCALTVTEIAALTGLSTSRVQSLLATVKPSGD